jgi:ferredoxin
MGDTFRVTIDRDECISCAACWTACPEFFEETPDDGFSQVVAQYRVGGDSGAGEAPGELESCVNEAADGCPVEIIHIQK